MLAKSKNFIDVFLILWILNFFENGNKFVALISEAMFMNQVPKLSHSNFLFVHISGPS